MITIWPLPDETVCATEMIQKVLDEAEKGEIQFKNGTYLLTNPIMPYSDMELFGEERDEVIFKLDGASVGIEVIEAENVIIRDITIKAEKAGVGIHLHKVRAKDTPITVVKDCTIKDVSQACIIVEESSSLIISDNICMSEKGIGIQVGEKNKLVTIRGNECLGNAIGINVIKNERNISVITNQCNGNKNGIVVESSDVTNVSGNNCNWNESVGITMIKTNSFGISKNITSDCSVGIIVDKCTGGGIDENKSNDNKGVSIVVTDSTHLSVSENECKNNEGTGIITSRVSLLKLVENVCEENKAGMLIDNGVSIEVIRNKAIGNEKNGITIAGCENVTISENESSNNKAGIQLSDSQNCKMKNNTCDGNETVALRLASSCDNEVKDNGCEDNGGYALWLDAGSHNNDAYPNGFSDSAEEVHNDANVENLIGSWAIANYDEVDVAIDVLKSVGKELKKLLSEVIRDDGSNNKTRKDTW